MALSNSHQIAYLVPLDQDLKENTSLPKVALSRGPNSIGRNTVSVSDKRLSRNHLTLTASPDGSASVLVEGSNPVVVNSGGQRRKLYSQQKETIANDDIIELILGITFLSTRTLSAGRNARSPNLPERSSNGEKNDGSRKRSRCASEDKAVKLQLVQVVELEDSSQVQENSLVAGSSRNSQSKGDSRVEAIRNFHVPDDKLPLTFRLLRVQGLPAWANTSSVSIGNVIQGNVIVALLSNYMVDIDWLLTRATIVC